MREYFSTTKLGKVFFYMVKLNVGRAAIVRILWYMTAEVDDTAFLKGSSVLQIKSLGQRILIPAVRWRWCWERKGGGWRNITPLMPGAVPASSVGEIEGGCSRCGPGCQLFQYVSVLSDWARTHHCRLQCSWPVSRHHWAQHSPAATAFTGGGRARYLWPKPLLFHQRIKAYFSCMTRGEAEMIACGSHVPRALGGLFHGAEL